jgi:ferrous iron transport protein B
VAAVASIKRELDSGIKALGVVILQCGVAWLVAAIVYQIGMLI